MINDLFSNFKNKDKLKPSSEMKDGRIYYKLSCGLEVYQEELTLKQNEEIVKLITELDMSAISLDSQIMELVKTLLTGNVLTRALAIILIPCFPDSFDASKLSQIKNSELKNIFNDFFLFNPTVVNWLKTIGDALISIGKIPSTKNLLSTVKKNPKDYQDTARKI